MKILTYLLRYKALLFLYAKYKTFKINSLINNNFDPLTSSGFFGKLLDERVIEYTWIFSKLVNIRGNVLDAGSVLNFKYLINKIDLDKINLKISTLAPEKKSFWKNKISYIYEDMRNSCFKDEYFDSIVCLSVIEHIGMDNTILYTDEKKKQEYKNNDYLLFIKEMHRILKDDGVLFLSIPYGKNISHEWLQVFDEGMINSLLLAFNPTKVFENIFTYNKNGWLKSNRSNASQSEYYDYRKQNTKLSSSKAISAESVILLELHK
jgi:predicted SAM-dependent methyltransferase